ncbi:MAG: beta-L-arabinofuranosidase domain-containing protein [Planctomycetota bacterium]|jgi:hypothetical protein
MVFIRIVSLVAALVLLSITLSVEAAALEHDYNIKPVPFNKVDVHDHFWTPRLQTNQNVTIPYAFWECEQTDRISNFEKAAGLIEGEHEGLYFNDSDVYKIMEGTAYSLHGRNGLFSAGKSGQDDKDVSRQAYSYHQGRPMGRWLSLYTLFFT